MLVVLDSNVLFSALISSHGAPHGIYEGWREGYFELATCPEQIEEIRRASRYPKLRNILQPHMVGLMLHHLHRARMLDNFPTKYEADDPHDAFLLNLTDAAQANYLITGDKRSGILRRRKLGVTSILTAAAFCEILRI